MDIFYDSQYLKNLKDMKVNSKFVCESLSRNNLKKIDKTGLRYVLSKCDERLTDIFKKNDIFTIVFSLDNLLYGKEKFSSRLNSSLKMLSINDWDIAPVLFYTAPKHFFLPVQELEKYASRNWGFNKKYKTYMEYNAALIKPFSSSEEKQLFQTPLEFVAALKTMNYGLSEKKKNPLVDRQDMQMFDEITDCLKKLNIYKVQYNEVHWINELFAGMTSQQKKTLVEEIENAKIHPYLKRLATQKYDKGVIIDGSNIIRAGLYQPDPLRMKDLMNALAFYPQLLFPIHFVFDANVNYVIKSSYRFWSDNFRENPNVKLFSPADDYILKKAFEKKYAVISNDKFRDFGALNVRLIRFQPEKGHFFLE